ncbi:MAG TPA: glutathione transferase GstA [Casimicrobiaceae bacterium]|nr:glutathione transferase GstA [Casimicrobiaceae bacterium]
MKLYYAPGACSLAPHIALIESGLPHQTVRVDLAGHRTEDGEDYFALNAKGYVPLLVLDDGTKLTEAGVVLQYIADRKPGTLAPAAGTLERYRVMEWLNYIATELHKGFGPLWNPKTPQATQEHARAQLAKRFELIEQALANKPYLAGETFTIADAYLFVVASWAKPLEVDLVGYPALRTFLQRVRARPGVEQALRGEGLLKAAA